MKKLLVNSVVKWWALPKCNDTLHRNIRQFTTKDLNVTSAGKVSTKMLDSKITKMCIRVKSHTNVNFVTLVLQVVGPMQCTSEVILVIGVQNNYYILYSQYLKKFIPKVSILGIVTLWGECRNIPFISCI